MHDGMSETIGLWCQGQCRLWSFKGTAVCACVY